MKKIHIGASVPYDVCIGQDLLQECGRMVSGIGKPARVMIVSDDRVYPLYGDTVRQSLEAEGMQTDTFVFAHGEASKCMAVYEELMEELCAAHLTRSDLLVALGGGVTGDLTGFAASTYQRGIRFVQIPTTLLAAVDSSVGGKTAINLKGGKNQAGSFHQPSLVICDTKTLDSLPEEEFRNGSAEVIKYGMIGNRAFLERLGRQPIREWLEEVIETCVCMKRDIVMQDEYDTGERMLLNFGHTLAHGVEKCSGYTIPHGYAVAMGMAAITARAEQKGICEAGTGECLNRLLEQYHLYAPIPYPAEDMMEAALADKKNTGSTIRIIVPRQAGKCVIMTIPADELREWM